MSIDLEEIISDVCSRHQRSTRAVGIQRMGRSWRTAATVRQSSRWSRKERLHLNVIDSLRDLPSLIPVTHMSCYALGEVVFQFEGIHPAVLAQKIIAVVHDDVGPGTGAVLRAGSCCKGWRTGGRAEQIGIGEQCGAKQGRGNQGKRPGNAEIVIAERVYDAELVRYLHRNPKVCVE